jgi:hypothetical protein
MLDGAEKDKKFKYYPPNFGVRLVFAGDFDASNLSTSADAQSTQRPTHRY